MPPNQTQNPKRNHHIVPALYLKGFVQTAGSPFLWVYTKGHPYAEAGPQVNPRYTAVKKAGMERDYYAEKKTDGTVEFEHHENLLEKLEFPAAAILGKIRSLERIGTNEKSAFAKYIVHMMKRTPCSRDWSENFISENLDQYRDVPELLARTPGNTPAERQENLNKEIVRLRASPDFKKGVHLHSFQFMVSGLSPEAVNKMTWRFFVASGNDHFVTGDNPVFIFKHIGLNKRDSELSFPISSDVALWATWRSDFGDGFSPGNSQVVKEFNRRTAQNATKHLYAARSEEWIVNLLNKERHRCNLLR